MNISSSRPDWASRSWPPAHFLAVCVCLASVYFILCLLGLRFTAIIHPSITAVWPGTGVALAAVLVLGYRVWPGVFLGALLVNIIIAGPEGPGYLGCLGIAIGNTLEGLLGAYLVNRFAEGCQAFERPHNVFRFVLAGSVISPMVSAGCGVLSLGTPWEKVGLSWGTWWLGDAVGALLLAPPLILWSTKRLKHDRRRRNPIQVAAVVLGLLLVALVVFADWLVPQEPNFPMAFVCLPLVMWVAFHFGQRCIATITLLIAVVAIAGLQRSQGALAVHPEKNAAHLLKAQVMLQSFLGLTAVTGLTLAAVVAERDRSEAELREAREILERRVRERTIDLARSNDALRHENEERQRAEQKFRDLLESAPDAMVIVDVRGVIFLVNAQAEKMFGYTRGEMVGQAVELIVPAQLRGQHQQHRQLYFLEPEFRPMGIGMQLHGRHKEGHEFPVEISLSPLKTEEGILVSSAIRDITNRQMTEEKLRQAERLAAVGEMIAGLAHESRNALQQSQACLELLALKVERWPDIANLVNDVQKAQDHLHYLYEEVRGYAAPIKLHRDQVDLGRLLLETWDSLTQLRQGRQAKLVQEAHLSALECCADPTALRHVLRNILENALHACSDPVEIRASWEEVMLNGQAALRLSLADNGPGLTPEARKRIFQPFFTTKIQGTGLGLAITRRIVEAHGGVITVGANPKPGMEILITLPR